MNNLFMLILYFKKLYIYPITYVNIKVTINIILYNYNIIVYL